MQEKISKDREEIEIIIKTIEGILQKDIKDTDENVYTIDGKQYKAIKNILKENEELQKSVDEIYEDYQDIGKKMFECLEEIAEQKAVILKNHDLYEQKCNENKLTDKEKEIVEAYRNLVKLTGKTGNWIVCDPTQMWSEHFIPKSLVKEKIEEYKKHLPDKTTYEEYKNGGMYSVIGKQTTYGVAIEVLQDLLGEE